MEKRCASEDSDSDSLPDPKTEFYSSPSESINPGDIVWAKFRYLYWPALVRACYPKQNKISIWYCDEPGKTFKLPLKNIYLFHDKEMSTKIQQDAKEAGVIKEHEGLTSHAIAYLRRRAKGYKDDLRKFFDQTYPFFLVEEMLKKDPNATISDIKIPPMYISHEKKMTVRKKVSAPKGKSDNSELESADSDSNGDCESKNYASDYLSEVNLQLQKSTCSPSKKIDIDAIIEYILSGKVDHYLRNIKSKRTASEYHNLFENSINSSRKNISEVTFTGLINDDSKLRKLIFYLLPLYEKIDSNALKNKGASHRKRKTTTSSSSFHDRKLGTQYVASVFLPESVIFAISKIKNISFTEAKTLFIGQSECKTKAIESILNCVDPSFPEKDTGGSAFQSREENVLQCKEKHESLGHSADTVDIMCTNDKSDVVYDEKKKIISGLESNKTLEICDILKSYEISSYDDGYEKKILDYILSGKTDGYLKKIRCKSMFSIYLDAYEQSIKSDKKKLCSIIYTGPVKDDDILKKLMIYLLSLYEGVRDSHKSRNSPAKKCKNIMISQYISKENPAVYYVMHVWLPESIIFAISEIGNVTLSHAKRVFDEYTVAKSASDILKYLD